MLKTLFVITLKLFHLIFPALFLFRVKCTGGGSAVDQQLMKTVLPHPNKKKMIANWYLFG